MIINADGSPKSKVNLLWENPDIASPFEEQTIAVDTNEYPILYVAFIYGSTSSTNVGVKEIYCNIRDIPQRAICTSGLNVSYRDITVTDEGIAVSAGTSANYTLGSHIQMTTSSNTVLIPYRVYGSLV